MTSDISVRQTALDPSRSFIVQAPAGSGKTALLVYRFLTLLAQVERPEQVLAITFTRKATSELRHRLLGFLQMAEQGHVTNDSFEQVGIELAEKALLRDREFAWNLLDTPHQLQIQTIDAFCGKLTGAMPWLSRLGDKPNTTDNAQNHYSVAVEQLFNELLDASSPHSIDLQMVMLELDFNYDRARRLFNAMLSRRDQWLRHLLQTNSDDLFDSMRSKLQQAWAEIRDEHLTCLETLITAPNLQSLTSIALKAAGLIKIKPGQSSPLLAFESFQAGDTLDKQHWLAIRFLLLTAKGDGFRKSLNINNGFPPNDKPFKKNMLDLINDLAEIDGLLEMLEQVLFLPEAEFSEMDWQQLLALEHVLKALAGLLQLRFRSMGECDHSEVTQRANLALQELQNPTELALRMDYQISHVLVDEFQDTSHGQLELLKKLTLGWELSESEQPRTLFLVGDPMQSIYRFREADVSLFLQVANNAHTHVFDNIHIESLRLKENFRSSDNLVNWFNQTFTHSFPSADHTLRGAISYARASSNKVQYDSAVYLQLASDKQQEAKLVVDAISTALEELPHVSKIAVLVRSRSHLKEVIPAMAQAGIAFTGVDIWPLKEAQAVIDLLALCKAISHLDDRVSWFALLRGPWCGLTLAEMKQLCVHAEKPIWQQINQANQGLAADSLLRLKRFCDVIERALEQRQQLGLHSVTRWSWQSLGGQHTLYGTSMQDIEQVFKLIEKFQHGGDLPSMTELEHGLDSLYAQAERGLDNRVIISTIHKAKGLQYDTVILPCLANPVRAEQKDVLMWAEYQNQHGQPRLLLAPLSSQEDAGSHYAYLRELERQRNLNETMRLMYVACTRAQRKLILIARLAIDENNNDIKAPIKNSMLRSIWEVVGDDFKLVTESTQGQASQDEVTISQELTRLPGDFRVQHAAPLRWQAQHQLQSQALPNTKTGEDDETIEFDWATSVATAVGMVMHDCLQFNQSSIFKLDVDNELQARWRAQLMSLAVPANRIDAALERLSKGVATLQQDTQARFIFSDYAIQKNEYALSTYEDGSVNNYRIDRTFVDENNTRWIVDYKTTFTRVDDVAAFVDQQVAERHRSQLQKYAALMSQIDDRAIKLAVYFPMLGQLRTWSYQRLLS